MKYLLKIVLILSSALSFAQQADTPTEARMRAMGLIDVHDADSSIVVFMPYTTTDNFVGKVLYDNVNKAFLIKDAATRLAKAQKLLKETDSSLSLLVYDAARPMAVQRQMWRVVAGTDKTDFVANPANGGGLHNYGAAVDVTIVGKDDNPLPMGTVFDYFGDEARINRELELLEKGKITRNELDNRLLLRKVMRESGFMTVNSEWWHFNYCSRDEAKKNLDLIE